MKVNTLVLLCLLLNLCVILGKSGQRRWLRPEGRRQAGFVNHNSTSQFKSRRSHSPAKVPNINADESAITFLDSYISIDETESSYNVIPGRQGHCKANGMIMYDKAVWSPKPCVICLCSTGKVVCDEMNCPVLKCARTIIPEGECCPICTSIEPNDPNETYHQDLHIEQEEQLRREDEELEEEELRRKDEEQKRKSKEKKRNDEERQRELEARRREEEKLRQIEEEELQETLAEEQKHLHEEIQESKEKEEKQLEKEMRNRSKTIEEEEEQDDDYEGGYEEQEEEQEEREKKERETEERETEERATEERETEEQATEERETEERATEERETEERETEERATEERATEEQETEEQETEEQATEEQETEEEQDYEEEHEEEQEESSGEEEDDDYADVFEFLLFPSILGSTPYHPDGETPRFSLPVGCDVTDITINCNNAKLTQIPPLSDLELKNLYLAGNSITTIPAGSFNGFPNLKWIDLSRNKILSSSIDRAAFKNLKKLERLHLDGNLLLRIPPQLPRTLIELKVNENLLQQLEEESFHGPCKIVNLEMEGNQLSESNVQPLAFRPLMRLAYLRLGRNKFRILPHGLPPSIEELYLEHNEIEEISEVSLNKTTKLNVIDLRNNKLDETMIAPSAWIKLKNLEFLDLSYNKIIHVPSYLPKGLLYLILIHNQIERIPGFVFAHMEPGLEFLYLSFNKLTSGGIDPVSFYGTYNTMRELFLDHNMLKRVPVGIAEMKALHFLRLNDNLIRNIRLEAICNVNDEEDSNIRTLHLENNYINTRRIPPTAFCCIELYSSVVLTPQKVKK
uniref:extracellular matrix protein 2 n=1 Tax=Pristiophorus japonicus TaxID=55135 RepID=UPI00398ED3EF